MDKVQIGDKVRIYRDPYTYKNMEGHAKLIKPIGSILTGGYQRWKVRFLNDPIDETYQRLIDIRKR